MKNDLISHGIVKNKSLILTFPEIRTDMIRHYIRGYFDGDGSLSRTTSRSKLKWEYQCKIMGTKEFLEEVQRCIGYPEKKLFQRNDDGKNTYYISIGGNKQVEKIMDFLYKDANVYLDRKHERYLELKAQSSGVGTPQSITL